MDATIQKPADRLDSSTPADASPHQTELETTKTLDSIIQAICLDAGHDTVKYLLRSNTGHDGE